eukprot:s114_g30.t1
MAHGAALVRMGHVMARREVPAEPEARLAFPDTAAREPTHKRVLRALRPVRGSIRFLDLGPGEPSVDTQVDEAPEDSLPPPAPPAPPAHDSTPTDGVVSTLKRAAEDTHEEPVAENENKLEKQAMEVESDEERKKRISLEVEQMFEELDKAEKTETEKRGRSRSPPPEDEQRTSLMNISHNAARQLDGLPPRPMTASELEGARRREVESDDELLAEGFKERKLSPEEKQLFDEAKDQVLRVWIENDAWRAVPMETVPATLSRMGKHLIYCYAIQTQWKLFAADVKSAFLYAG